MTDNELKAIQDGFKHLAGRISDLEAKLNNRSEEKIIEKKDTGLKFDDMPDELKEDKSEKIKQSWFDKPLF